MSIEKELFSVIKNLHVLHFAVCMGAALKKFASKA